jgi:hypothetical protein
MLIRSRRRAETHLFVFLFFKKYTCMLIGSRPQRRTFLFFIFYFYFYNGLTSGLHGHVSTTSTCAANSALTMGPIGQLGCQNTFR